MASARVPVSRCPGRASEPRQRIHTTFRGWSTACAVCTWTRVASLCRTDDGGTTSAASTASSDAEHDRTPPEPSTGRTPRSRRAPGARGASGAGRSRRSPTAPVGPGSAAAGPGGAPDGSPPGPAVDEEHQVDRRAWRRRRALSGASTERYAVRRVARTDRRRGPSGWLVSRARSRRALVDRPGGEGTRRTSREVGARVVPAQERRVDVRGEGAARRRPRPAPVGPADSRPATWVTSTRIGTDGRAALRVGADPATPRCSTDACAGAGSAGAGGGRERQRARPRARQAPGRTSVRWTAHAAGSLRRCGGRGPLRCGPS